jgi:hypothetical protein
MLGLWVLSLIKCSTSTILINVGLTHSHLPQAEAFFIHTLAPPLATLNGTRRLTTFVRKTFDTRSRSNHSSNHRLWYHCWVTMRGQPRGIIHIGFKNNYTSEFSICLKKLISAIIHRGYIYPIFEKKNGTSISDWRRNRDSSSIGVKATSLWSDWRVVKQKNTGTGTTTCMAETDARTIQMQCRCGIGISWRGRKNNCWLVC